MSVESHNKIVIISNTGGMKSLLDGATAEFTASEWRRIDYQMPESFHMQGLRVRWKGAFTGDYGFLVLINPINGNGYVSPSVAVSMSATAVDLGDAAVAANFNPAAGAQVMEFWNDADTSLVECRPIASVAGTVVTLGQAVTSVHSTSAKLRCVVDSFSPCRGTECLDGGFRLLAGNGVENIRSEHNFTDLIPVGLILGSRFKATSDVGTRALSINYRFRRP